MDKLLLTLLLLTLLVPTAHAGSPEPGTSLRQLLETRNREFSEAFVGENLAAVMGYYADAAMLMPEHSTARYRKASIEDYYRQWFAAAAVGKLQKTIHEVLDYGDYAVETGFFVQSFSKPGSQAYDYSGKYMVVWAIDGTQPRIVSELWGANAPFDDAVLPAIEDAAPVTDHEFANDARVAEEIGGRNAIVRRLVSERKGEEHAGLFLADAIYMTYYMPMLVGMENIRPYFIEHERPGGVTIDSLELSAANIIPMDDGKLQLEQGFYRVAWRAGSDSGMVAGKSLNLWKRDKEGTLMLYRQAVNHD